MDVFAFRDELVAEYARFSRSFTRIRAADISRAVDEADAAGRFWPAPLIQLNPSFEPGGWIYELVAEGLLDPECANIFRLKNKNDVSGKPLRLHRHQTDAIQIANRRESYVLTTGTGSGRAARRVRREPNRCRNCEVAGGALTLAEPSRPVHLSRSYL